MKALWFVLGFVVLALVWMAALVFGLPLWVPAVLTVLAVAGVVALVVQRRMRAHRSAREIEAALTAQADAHERMVSPDQQPQIQAMKDEFARAVAALKGSKLARGGTDALSVLPWYLIIGPPGAGKTTALAKSGLQFPYLSKDGGVQGVGGTRNCKWWLNNQAVILDTAGRYSTEDDDREEWQTFLDTLARARPRRPVNGLIVAVDVDTLCQGDEEAASQLGQTLRERLDEVTQRLKMVLPVYVFVTKVDHLLGFTEVFADLPKSERGQIWGFTSPLSERTRPVGEVFTERFGELCGALEKRAVRRVGQELRQEARERIFRFPQQFEALQSRLGEFVQALFAENVFQDAPVMRGVYFTSGTQEGRAFDRMMDSLAGVMNLPAMPAAEDGPVKEAKSYFLLDVFTRVIFPDQDLAVRSSSGATDDRRIVYGIAGLGIACALALMLFPARSFLANRELVARTQALFSQVDGLPKTASGEQVLAALSPLGEHLDMLLRHQQEGVPAGMGLGMYAGDTLFEPVRGYYAAAVHRLLMKDLLKEDVTELERFAAEVERTGAAPSDEAHLASFDRLKLHLLLTGPKAEGEPALGEAERAWVVGYLRSRWLPGADSADVAETVQALLKHVEVFTRLVQSDPSLLGPRDAAVVKRARWALAQLPASHFALQQLLANPALEEYDLSLRDMLGTASTQLTAERRVTEDGAAQAGQEAGQEGEGAGQDGAQVVDVRVRGAFTLAGYNAVVKPALEAVASGQDLWVVGPRQGAEMTPQALAAELRERYYQRYVQEWDTFLSSVQVVRPRNVTEAVALMDDLTRGPTPPFAMLFDALGRNVRLPREAGEVVEGAVGGVLQGLRSRIEKAADRKLGSDTQVLPAAGAAPRRFGAQDVEASFAGLLRFGAPPPRRGGDSDEKRAQGVPLDLYQEQLVLVRDALRAYQQDAREGKGTLKAALETANVKTESLIKGQDPGSRPRLLALLMPPLAGAGGSYQSESGKEVNGEWCSAVVAPFERLRRSYPFRRDGTDAPLADVADFFRPKSGSLWGFYEASLKSDVPQRGNSFGFAPGVRGYRGEVLRYLANGLTLSSALFGSGQEMAVRFSVHVRPTPRVASVSLVVDGQAIEYRNGPEEWHRMVWPSVGKKQGAELRVRTTQGATETLEQDGEWGLYRLLEAGDVQVGSDGYRFTGTWKMRTLGVDVTLDFKPERSATPFFGALRPGARAPLLAPFRLAGVAPPTTIVAGGGTCSL